MPAKAKKNSPSPGMMDTQACILLDYCAPPVHAPPAAADMRIWNQSPTRKYSADKWRIRLPPTWQMWLQSAPTHWPLFGKMVTTTEFTTGITCASCAHAMSAAGKTLKNKAGKGNGKSELLGLDAIKVYPTKAGLGSEKRIHFSGDCEIFSKSRKVIPYRRWCIPAIMKHIPSGMTIVQRGWDPFHMEWRIFHKRQVKIQKIDGTILTGCPTVGVSGLWVRWDSLREQEKLEAGLPWCFYEGGCTLCQPSLTWRRLQLDNITFRVGDVAPSDFGAGCNLQGHNFTNCTSTRLKNCFLDRCYIINWKCNMCETWSICGSHTTTFEYVVVENFQCGTVFPITWQTQMRAAQMCVWNTRSRFKFFTLEVAFWGDWDTTKELLIEVGKRLPIFSNKIRVNIFGRKIHVLSLENRLLSKRRFSIKNGIITGRLTVCVKPFRSTSQWALRHGERRTASTGVGCVWDVATPRSGSP